MIVKGKRSKRLRASSSASSSGGDFNSNSLVSSPTSTSTSREEDEDLANCLILLARGGLGPQKDRAESKFNCRQFTETAAPPTNGKVGVYIYECKTCSRSFSSFQALGGHRASHKKSKSATDFDQKKSQPAAPLPDKEAEEVEEAKFTIAPPPPTELIGHIENKLRIHECSICGSEFASGQALGGHMRRHRSGPAADAAMRSAGDFSSHDDHQVVEKARRMLALDLNLPAPEDDGREAEFRAFSSNQQPRLVFSAAALVDCHY